MEKITTFPPSREIGLSYKGYKYNIILIPLRPRSLLEKY